METLLARNVSCSRNSGSETETLANVTLGFEAASLNLVIDKNGSGKNLLLRALGLIDRPDSGEVLVSGISTHGWTDIQCAEFRNRHFGFVFEGPLLLPSFNVVENIAMPFFKLTEETPEHAREETFRVLAHVGMSEYAGSAIDSLPHWAQHRVALARALIMHPQAVFVENIDKLLRDTELISFLELLDSTRRSLGCCIVATATSRDVVQFFSRVVEMTDGQIARDWKPGGLSP